MSRLKWVPELNDAVGLKALQTPELLLLRPKNVALVLYLTGTHGNPGMGMGAISRMLAVVR